MNSPAILTSTQGEPVPLQDVAVTAVLQDLLAEVTVSQTWFNAEPRNIEAVYTFPLPRDAVLLDLEVTLGARVLRGVITGKQSAEQQYEDALEAGNSAVMLESAEPGLYTMNLGNLLAQEAAKITFRYAILYRWAGDRLRFFLPTTIAPRYGGWQHRPHQAPVHSLVVENHFSLRVEVFGVLRDAAFACPTHAVQLTRQPGSTVLSLQQPKAVMDRDFVLNVRAPQAVRSFVLSGQDGEGAAAIASFQPFFPGLRSSRPLALAIVIDCSGSMHGDSIAQARLALDRILDSLQPQDSVSIIAFGSTASALSRKLLPCNPANLAKARRFAQKLQADRGGTEIENALDLARTTIGDAGPGDVFLLTDGHVGNWQRVVKTAAGAGHRVFTVGVGSAVSDAFLQGLAAATGGHCELVTPGEGMADRVVRHFERMRAPRAKRVALHWPPGAAHISPSCIGAVFEGDTVVASALFEHAPENGVAILEVESEDGAITRQELAFPAITPAGAGAPPSTVARIAAAAHLEHTDAALGTQLALRYQLLSPWTNCLVIAEREESRKPIGMPALRKVPQTLAAGWGGMGDVGVMRSAGVSRRADDSVARSAHVSDSEVSYSRRSHAPDSEHASRKIDRPLSAYPKPLRPLMELLCADPSRLSVDGALGLLTQSGLRTRFEELLRLAEELGLRPEPIAAIILNGLLAHGAVPLPTAQLRLLAFGSIMVPANTLREALKHMTQHGAALTRLTAKPDVGKLLARQEDEDAIQRIARIRRLLRAVDKALQEATKELLSEAVAA